MGAGVHPRGGERQAKDTGREGPPLPVVPRQPADVARPAPLRPPFHCPRAPSEHLLPDPTSRPRGPDAAWPGASLRSPGDPRHLRRPRGSPRGAAPRAPASAHLRYRPRAGSRRSEGGRSRAPGSQLSRPGAPSSVGSRFQFLPGRRDRSVSESGRARLALRPPRSPPPRARLTSPTGCRGRAGASPRVLLNSDGGGSRLGSCRPTGGRHALREAAGKARPAGCGGPADWVGQEKGEPALRRSPLLPREERLLFLLRLSLDSPSGASSSLAARGRRARDRDLGLQGIRPLSPRVDVI